MTDPLLVLQWLALAVAVLVACALARRAGVPAGILRDFVHVGAGLWPLGWTFWSHSTAPIALSLAGAAGAFAVPILARRIGAFARIQQSISNEDEHWGGVQLYGAAYAAGTIVAFRTHLFAPAAGLLALALGDGLGGAFGRRFGKHYYGTPQAKPKTIEGSLAVATLSMIAVGLAAWHFGVPTPGMAIVGAGAAAALAEAVAPAGTDNVLVPSAVWLYLVLQGGSL